VRKCFGVNSKRLGGNEPQFLNLKNKLKWCNFGKMSQQRFRHKPRALVLRWLYFLTKGFKEKMKTLIEYYST
jgi:hypothetical protein